jgi:hypothetical protein
MSQKPSVLLGGDPDDDTVHKEPTVKNSPYGLDEANPAFILVDVDPKHIWIDDEHLIETDDRRLKPGKHLLTVTGGSVLYEVVEERDSEKFSDSSVPDHIDDVNDPSDEIVLKSKYSLEDEVRMSGTQSFPRYQFETEDALSMGDAPPLVFKPQSN